MSHIKGFLTEHRDTLLQALQRDALDAKVQRFLDPSEEVAHPRDLTPHTLPEPLVRALALALDQVTHAALEPRTRLDLTIALQRRAAALNTHAPGTSDASLSEDTIDLLNVIMHDLRSPLVTLRGYVEMMVRGKLGDLNAMQERAMRVASRNVISLDDQIDVFLEYIRLRQGRMQLNIQPVELDTLFHQSAEALHITAERKGLGFHTQPPHELAHTRVLGDADKLKRLIRILVINALKITAEGHITLNARRTHDGLIEISVTDTGPAPPTQDSEPVSDPLARFQSDDANANINATVAAAIASAHNTQLTLHRTDSGEARLAIRLPQH